MREEILALLRGAKGYVSGEEIGEKLGISRSYVSRIEKKALTKLYEGLNK